MTTTGRDRVETRGRTGGPDGTDHTLVYDGDCGMCTRWMERVRRWDRQGRIEILPLQDPSVLERFPWVDRDRLLEAMHLIGPDGTTWAGAAAAERLLRILPYGGWFSWVFALPGARPVAERVYRWVATNRTRMGCGEHCTIDPGAAQG